MTSDYSRPIASNLSKQQVYEFAEMVQRELEFEPGGDLNELVDSLGGQVIVKDTIFDDPEQSGSLYVDDIDSFRIIIPSHTSPKRDRFTIAHELGHFFLHYLLPDRHLDLTSKKMLALRKDSDRVEWEANWFSSAFLMPSDAFKTQFRVLDGDISQLSDYFDVSYSAAEVRVKSLGLEEIV